MANGRSWRLRSVAVAAVLVVAPLVAVSEAHATPTLSGLTGINAGGDHTCGITSGGAAECWGINTSGELGDNSFAQSTTPHAVDTSTGMTAPLTSIVLGFHHTCALTNAGTAWCWGLNDHGEIGNGFSLLVGGVVKPSKLHGVKATEIVTQLALGGQHSCALMNDGAVTGDVKCWGANDVGQLGDGGFGTSAFEPVQVSGLTSGVVQVVAAQKHTCALTNAGAVLCWGQNAHGELGNGTVATTVAEQESDRFPTPVTGLSSGVKAITAGGEHVCALTTSDGVKCWGFNSSGQLGNGTIIDQSTPVDVNGLTSGVASISAGGSDTCAIDTSGVLDCWGNNSNGQIGTGTPTPRLTFFSVPTGAAPVLAIATGRLHNCLTLVEGSKCWGANAAGQLGNGATIDLLGPFVPDPPVGPTASAGDATATVTWTKPTSDGDFGFNVGSYSVSSSPSLGAPRVVLPSAVLSTTFTGLQNGTTYTFTVTATNPIGTSAPATSNAVTPAGVPGAPSQLGVATGDQSATVTWHPAPPNGAAPTRNRVTILPGGRVIDTSGSATSAVIAGLTNGNTYTFKVNAVNRVGSGPSASISRKIPIPKSGYWMLGANGSVYAFGNSQAMGSASYPGWPSGVAAVAIAPRRDGKGYWVVDSTGGVHAFGAARSFGDHPALRSGERVSSIAPTPTNAGYYLFTNRGRAITYGDAKFFGDMSNVHLNGPVIASNTTPTGRGYFMVASDGGVFSFGDARFHGSTGGIHLNKPVVGLSPTPSNGGYWLVASDGGVFAFGDARFRGSMGAVHLNRPVNGLVPLGNGYLMVASDGGVFDFSDKPFYGSLAANPPPAPIIGIAAFVF